MATKKKGFIAQPVEPLDFDAVMGALATQAPPEQPASTTGRMRRVLGDMVGIPLLKGAIAVPEAAVGLADMVTGGQAGRMAEQAGFRPKEARAIIDEWKSPEQQAADMAVQMAGDPNAGVMTRALDKLGAALQNPSTIASTVVEALPGTLAGGVVGRGVAAVAPRMGAIGAGAAGEGIIGAGATAEQVRQQTDDGLLTGRQAAIAAGSGALTGGFTLLGGRVAKALGVGDIDTLAAQAAGTGMRAAAAQGTQKHLVRKVLEGAASEGVLEELPQSIQEQVAQNLALGKPLDEGVDHAAVMGLLAGGVMGGAAAPFARPGDELRREKMPESGPMTKALNAAVEAAAQKADAGEPIPAAPATSTVAPAQPADEAMVPQAPAAPVLQPSAPDAVNPATGEVLPQQELQAQAREQRQADQPAQAMGEVLPGDVLNGQGTPFKTMPAAMRRLAKLGDTHEIVPVAGGLVLRPKLATLRDSEPDAVAPAVQTEVDAVPAAEPVAAAPAEPAPEPAAAAPEPVAETPEPAAEVPQAPPEAVAKPEVPAELPMGQEQGGEARVVQVAGKDYTLTPEQRTELEKVEADFKGRFDKAKADFENASKFKGTPENPDFGLRNPKEQYEATKKALGLKLSAERRRIVGAQTAKEQAKATEEAGRIRTGDAVATPDGNGTVTGMAFGKVRVRREDGTSAAYPRADVQKAEPPQAQAGEPAEGPGGSRAKPAGAKPDTVGPAMRAAMESVGLDPDAKPDKAKELRRKAEKMQKEARDMLAGIPAGQPIHSTRDRNLRDRAIEKTRKAGELFDEADKLDAASKSAPQSPELTTGAKAQAPELAEPAKAGGFDSEAWNKARDDRIKASREAGNTHLDEVPAYVETMRGKPIFYVHDEKVRGTIRTVDSNGNVYVNWDDAYSAEKELASPVRDGKKTVMQSSLGPRDLKDYALSGPKKQPAASQPKPEAPAQDLKARVEAVKAAKYGDLEKIAERLGVKVFKAAGGWHAGGGVIDIPDGDVDVVATGAVSASHVFAHELAHVIMEKRGFSFHGFPKAEVVKRIPNYDALISASKEFRPGVHTHENERFRRHAMKPNEVLADGIASVLLGDKPIALIEPLMQATGMTRRDLGLEDAPAKNAEPAPADPAAAEQQGEDYLTKLFGTPEEQAAAQAKFTADAEAKKRDVVRIRDAITAEKKRAQASHDDWASRQYKANKTQVDLRGDGPSNQDAMSIGAINESRRRNAMEALAQEIGALDKLADALSTDAGAERVLGNMRDLMDKAQKAADSGNWPGSTPDSMFESMLLEDLKFRGPAGKGNVTSNGLSKAVLVAMKGEGGVAPTQDSGGAAPAKKDRRTLQEKVERPAGADEVVASVGEAEEGATRKFYVTMVRGDRVARLAGPFDTKEEAEAMKGRAQDEANKADPRSAFDAFGVSAITSKDHKPGTLNEQLGIGAVPAAEEAPAPAVEKAATPTITREQEQALYGFLLQQTDGDALRYELIAKKFQRAADGTASNEDAKITEDWLEAMRVDGDEKQRLAAEGKAKAEADAAEAERREAEKAAESLADLRAGKAGNERYRLFLSTMTQAQRDAMESTSAFNVAFMTFINTRSGEFKRQQGSDQINDQEAFTAYIREWVAKQSATPSKTPTIDAHMALFKSVRAGTSTPDEFKAMYRRVRDGKETILAELNTSTKDQLVNGLNVPVRPGTTKGELVSLIYDALLRRFALGKSFGPNSYMMGQEKAYAKAKQDALDALVEGQTAESLAEYAAELKAEFDAEVARRAAVMESVKDPKTLDDFRTFMRMHEREGKTLREARFMLTPEQRAKMDELSALETRSRRGAAKEEQRTQVRVAGQTVDGDIIATKHTKKGHDLFVVKLSERVSREDYETLNAGAKRIGGYYSSFRGAGAIPGFQFTTREQAQAFVTLAQGDNTAAVEAAKERRNAFEDDRSQTAVQRLTEMADRLEERADESLGRERKANTDRRARMAASAEASAQSDKALARTMRNIASGIEAGTTKFLDRVRQKTQVELLQSHAKSAFGELLRAKYQTYAEQERHFGDPITAEAADYAEFPNYTAYRSDLASLGRQLLEVDGTKKLGERMMKVADDVSDAFTAWAKEPGNYYRLSVFTVNGGERPSFKTSDAAERSIARSGHKGKAMAWQVKRGEWTVIMSPSEAMARGVWKGDGDKRITLSDEFGAELVEKIGRANRRGAKVSVPWQFERAYTQQKTLGRMGIETPFELRAALREFINLREAPPPADKVKAMERAMIGRRNDGLDFFPTPESVADEMVAAADIQPGMRVLEPSAGWGHIAERIRDAGFDPDLGEISNDRRELLEAKGFIVKGRDFMEMSVEPNAPTVKREELAEIEAYRDAVRGDVLDTVRTALHFFDRGDIDGAATMMARATRQAEFNESARTKFGDIVQRLEAQAKGGYDRILMNPPFSEGRDIQHVRHAYSLLKPGGRLVAIMGESAFTNSFKRAEEFRAWLEQVGGTDEKLPEGSFNDPSLPANTSANARMVVIDKPESGGGGGEVAFSRNTTQPSKGTTTEAVQRVADTVASLWENAPPIVVVQDMADARIPDAVRAEYKRQNDGGAVGEAAGFIAAGRVYLVAGQLSSDREAVTVLFHEALGHYGLRGVFGKALAPILDELAKRNPGTVAAKAKQYGLDFQDPAQRRAAAEEVLAEMAQTRPTVGWVQRAVAAIRGFLRRLGLGLKFSDAEIAANFLIPAREWVKRGPQMVGEVAPAFSRQDQTETEAFRKWFGDSKVVDAQGKPLVVYHGTKGSFDTFDVGRQGQSDFGASGRGFYFSQDPGSANLYANLSPGDGAPNTMPVYVALQNPYEMGALLPQDEAQSKLLTERLKAEGYDGIVVRGADGVFDEIVAFRPEQIKSATGNRGTFDPNDPDIRFSRTAPAEGMDPDAARDTSAKQRVIDYAHDLLQTSESFNWWHKTVGTQYHKARTNAAFRQVYDKAQEYLHDTSAFANDPADLAPQVLRQLRTLGDVTKSLTLKKDDGAKLSQALFDGTLNWRRDDSGQVVEAVGDETAGIVFTPEELKAKFGFNDAQVTLYQQTRAAIDRSLDILAASDVARYIGKGLPPALKAMISQGDLGRFKGLVTAWAVEQKQQADQALADARRERRNALAAHWRKQKKALEGPEGRAGRRLATMETLDAERAKLNLEHGGKVYRAEQAAKNATQVEQDVRGKYERIDQLKAQGYAPLMRFGRFTVDVLDAAGARVFFGMYETEREANAAARKFRADPELAEGKVTQGVLSEQAYRQFSGMTPETLELFAEVAGVEQTELFQQYLRLAKNNRSAMKRLIRRTGVEGFSDDVPRVLSSFLTSNARAASSSLHAGEMHDAVEEIPKEAGDVKDEAIKLREYVQNPQEEAQAIRSLLFAQFLGGSVASAMVNMTQPIMMTLPYLSQFGGAMKATSALANAVRAAVGKAPLGSDLERALAQAAKEGITEPQELHQLQAEASRSTGNRPGVRRLMFVWGSFFQLAEAFNRKVSFIAAYNMAKERGDANPFKAAARAVDETQGIYNRGNRPNWARGALGSMVFTFKQYSISYMEFLTRLPKKERMLALAILVLAAGAGGLPGADDLDDLIDTLGQNLGYDTNAKLWKQRVLTDAVGEDAAEFVLHGLSALPGVPLDVSGRLGLGNLVPGTGFLLKSKTDKASEVTEALGPAASLVVGMAKAVPAAMSGDAGGVIQAAAPVALKNLSKSIEMFQTGEYRDTLGRKVTDVTQADALMKGIGFQPATVAQDSRRAQMANQQVALARTVESEIAAQWAQAMVEKDAERVAAARQRLADWNERNPGSRIVITPKQIRRRVQQLVATRDQRQTKAAPKEMRAMVAEVVK